MENRNFSDIGRDVGRAVKNALHSNEFSELKHTVKDAVKSAAQNVKHAADSANEGYTTPPGYRKDAYQPPREKSTQPAYSYSAPAVRKNKMPAGSVSGVLFLVFGLVFGIPFAIAALVFAILTAVFSGVVVFPILTACFAPIAAGCAAMVAVGARQRGRVKRYRCYCKVLDGRTFCEIRELAAAVRKDHAFVAKDLHRMIRLRMFPDGHIDEQETCLMTDQDTYEQYLELQESVRQRQLEEQRRREMEEKDPNAALLHKTIDEGREYLRQIREANDAMPGEDISNKLFRLEDVTAKIFSHVQQHPQKLPEIRKFMSYYLPTTLKLVNTYREFEEQPVQGENITAAKREIRDTLDTISAAFEKLLDRLFEDDALDISTDISVLQTMLAQEGLTGHSFEESQDKGPVS